MADEVKENNKQLVYEIKIDAEMMRKIIDEKMAQIELDIQGIRAKVIDEFAEKLKKIIEKDLANPDLMLDCKKCGIWKAKDIDEIAEQMKGGAI